MSRAAVASKNEEHLPFSPCPPPPSTSENGQARDLISLQCLSPGDLGANASEKERKGLHSCLWASGIEKRKKKQYIDWVGKGYVGEGRDE